MTLLGHANIAQAQVQSFFDSAVADAITQTKSVESAWFALGAGATAYGSIDYAVKVTPATWQPTGSLAFAGIPTRKTTRWLRALGQFQLGTHNDTTHLDAGVARLTIFSFQRGSRLGLGIGEARRDKSMTEKSHFTGYVARYSTGGHIKGFVLALSTRLLGYERTDYYRKLKPYNGLFLVGLNLDFGVVLFRKARISVQTDLAGELDISWPMQRDVDLAGRVAVHINNDYVPIELTAQAGYHYMEEKSDNNFDLDAIRLVTTLAARF